MNATTQNKAYWAHVSADGTRSQAVRQHLLGTAMLAEQFAQPFGADSQAHLAGLLHDIGKISIPDTILNKPGRLTAEEFEVIKTHAMVGADMLSDLPIEQQEAPLVKVASEICRWHHERYDGNGYPDGLKGEEIPISAQVVALADVYDALTSERCYKKAYSHEESLKMILEGQCGAFNPALLLCLEEIADLLESEFSFFDKNKDSTASSEREE